MKFSKLFTSNALRSNTLRNKLLLLSFLNINAGYQSVIEICEEIKQHDILKSIQNFDPKAFKEVYTTNDVKNAYLYSQAIKKEQANIEKNLKSNKITVATFLLLNSGYLFFKDYFVSDCEAYIATPVTLSATALALIQAHQNNQAMQNNLRSLWIMQTHLDNTHN